MFKRRRIICTENESAVFFGMNECIYEICYYSQPVENSCEAKWLIMRNEKIAEAFDCGLFFEG